MAKLLVFLACQFLLAGLLVEGLRLDPLNGFRTKRSPHKPWTSLATCLQVPSTMSSTARNMLQFIQNNSQIGIVSLASHEPRPTVANAHVANSKSICAFSLGKDKTNMDRLPKDLAKAVCQPPQCNPTFCQAVKYHVPVLVRKNGCGKVWEPKFEEVTVAFL